MATELLQDFNTLVTLDGKPAVIADDDAVQNAVLNIVLIQRRSRKFRTTWGSQTHWYLQLPVDDRNARQYRASLYNDLKKWAGQIASFSLDGILVTPYGRGDGYMVAVAYQSNLTGYRSQVTVQLPSISVNR